ncbi:MAG: hypothetical protein VX738_12690 [Planctomycetota bacterium]|nr:hypothetical protein [Planctomycetota bacterium]
MAPAHICIALGPLAVYLLFMGLMNALRRPLITTGTRDLFSLSIALAGLIMIGPINLFVPQHTLSLFGSWTWLLMAALYIFIVLLISFSIRPRLIIYNLSAEQLKTILGRLVAELDPDARWAGDNVELPNLGIQLSLDARSFMRSCQITSIGQDQSPSSWAKLQRALADELAKIRVPTNPYAISMIAIAMMLATLIAQQIIQNHTVVYNQIRDLLQL